MWFELMDEGLVDVGGLEGGLLVLVEGLAVVVLALGLAVLVLATGLAVLVAALDSHHTTHTLPYCTSVLLCRCRCRDDDDCKVYFNFWISCRRARVACED